MTSSAIMTNDSKGEVIIIKEIINNKIEVDPIGYYEALLNGDLLHYLYYDLKKAQIDVHTFLVYEKSLLTHLNPSTVNTILKKVRLEKDINCTSLVLDQWLFAPYYHHIQSCNHVSISEVLSSYNSSDTIIPTLKQIKVISATYSICGFTLAYGSMMMGHVSLGALLSVASFDLLCISYNCFIKRYCSLYVDLIMANASCADDTIRSFVKRAVGLNHHHPQLQHHHQLQHHLERSPFMALYTDIHWNNLLQDTIAQTVVIKVSYISVALVLTYNCIRCEMLVTISSSSSLHTSSHTAVI